MIKHEDDDQRSEMQKQIERKTALRRSHMKKGVGKRQMTRA